MKHINFPILLDFLEDELMPNEREAVKNHLMSCAACQKELGMARIIANTAGGHGSRAVEPPPLLVQRAMLAFRRKQASVTPPKFYQAVLQYDSCANAASLGSRGKSSARQYYYSVYDFDLDLQVTEEESKGTMLMGQILPNTPYFADLEASEVALISNTGERRLGLTDNLGRFRFSYLTHGNYNLKLIVANQTTLVNSLAI